MSLVNWCFHVPRSGNLTELTGSACAAVGYVQFIVGGFRACFVCA
jgi:hypothetical protein